MTTAPERGAQWNRTSHSIRTQNKPLHLPALRSARGHGGQELGLAAWSARSFWAGVGLTFVVFSS